jgi:hypothetical protein
MASPALCARLAAGCILGALALPASAAVLLTGYGSAPTEDAARAAAREDLAYRLQRAVARRLQTGAAQRAFPEGREFPLVGIELASAGAHGGRQRYEARLSDASLAAYEREAGWLAERLRKVDPAKISTDRIGESFAWLDQYRRIAAVRRLFSKPSPEIGLDDAVLARAALKNLSPSADAGDVAKTVKAALARSNLTVARVVAPVRAENSEVTSLSGQIADALRGELATQASGGRYVLDGSYDAVDGKILLRLYLLDASFNTERAFAFVLAAAEPRSRALPGRLSETLNRGLVRIDSLDDPAAPSGAAASGKAMGVDVKTERGKRGLYYRPGDQDQLYVKLDRPGYYYVVGHVDKPDARFSYLMEIGDRGSANRFVRRVGDEQANQWLPIGKFTVEPPLGLEALQVFAASEDPTSALPAARFDSARSLYVIAGDPADAAKRSRGLVLVNMGGDSGDTAPKAGAAAVGEAVLQFSTLP